MSSFEIVGGKRLSGEIVPQGAKNEALQVICAVLLTDCEVTIDNVPDIRDVNKLIELLEYLGVKVHKLAKGTYSFKADRIDMDRLSTERYSQMAASLRGSVMLAGAMLGRFHRAFVPTPGGDKIGRRRLDTHFSGFEKLGATINYSFEKKSIRSELQSLGGLLYVVGRSLGNGNCKHNHGSRFGRRHDHNFQCSLRTIRFSALHHAQFYGSKDFGSGKQPSDNRRRQISFGLFAPPSSRHD